jgi:hypothetical protein
MQIYSVAARDRRLTTFGLLASTCQLARTATPVNESIKNLEVTINVNVQLIYVNVCPCCMGHELQIQVSEKSVQKRSEQRIETESNVFVRAMNGKALC